MQLWLFIVCLAAVMPCHAYANSLVEQVKELKSLLDEGIITEAEFAEAKSKLMKTFVDESAPPPAAQDHATSLPMTHYVPLGNPPAGSLPRQEKCPADFQITGVDEWIQGETTPDAGALTVLFFFSQSCHICHDVAPTLSKLHTKYKDRGLQVIGIHATPKGFKEPPAKIAALREFIDSKKLAFSIVDTHSKEGAQPVTADGEPDYKAAGEVPVTPGSLWEKVTTGEGQPEPYGVPLVIVTKNCKKVAIVGGYQISDLEDALKPHFDSLLWGGSKKKRKTKKKSKEL